jgi:transposase
MAFIRKVKTASGATAVQIATKHKGHVVKIDHIGSAHTNEELQVLLSLAQKKLHTNQIELFPEATSSLQVGIKRTYSGLLWGTLRNEYQKLSFTKLEDAVFEAICLSRIVEPTSKIDSLRVLADLGLEAIDRNKLYRSLARAAQQGYRETISQACFEYVHGETLSLVLYDVTSLYFEVQKEDDFRKPGLSKERRLEPQIIIGLLVDKNGFPLGLQSFEGNKAETKTILPVIKAFQEKHNLSQVTVVAEAAMLSASNLAVLAEAGYSYVVGSRLSKVPYELEEYQKTDQLQDQQIIVVQHETFRTVYQYRAKRAALDLRNIEKQITKAKKVIAGQIAATRTKFLTLDAQSKRLNHQLIEKAKALVGIKGYVTNLDIPDEEIIACYHQLFQVEASFRMAKSDLKARPIYHRKRDAIEAHLTIVLAALAVSKSIEAQTGISIKQFIKLLRPIRSGVITINSNEIVAEPEIPLSIKSILMTLSSGH